MNLRDLSILCYGHGFTLWHYRDTSAIEADVLRPGFFNMAGDRGEHKLLAPGDVILCNLPGHCIQVWIQDVSAAGVLVDLMTSSRGSQEAPLGYDLSTDRD